VGLNSIINT